MSVISPGGSEGFPEIECPLDDSVAAFEATETDYFQMSAAYLNKPTREAAKGLTGAVNTYVEAFTDVIKTVVKDEPLSDALEACSGIIKGADKRRTSYFNAITKDKTTTPLGEDFNMYLEIDDNTAADESGLAMRDEVVDFVTDAFIKYVRQDTDLLLLAAVDSPGAKMIRFKHELQKHAIDIGKITVGVALGSLFARKFDR